MQRTIIKALITVILFLNSITSAGLAMKPKDSKESKESVQQETKAIATIAKDEWKAWQSTKEKAIFFLVEAIAQQNALAVKFYLRIGANPNSTYQDETITTPEPLIFLLIPYFNQDVAELLIRYGGNVNILNSKQQTPLHYACEENFEEVVKFFVIHKAIIDAQDENGNTPLHEACRNGHTNLARYLVSQGAQKTLRNNNKETALDCTPDSLHEDMLKAMITGYESEIQQLNKLIPAASSVSHTTPSRSSSYSSSASFSCPSSASSSTLSNGSAKPEKNGRKRA